MLEHIQKNFPDQCSGMDEEDLRQLVSDGVEIAAGYGFQSEKDVCKYIDLMVYFGAEFDRNGEFPWAMQILNDEKLLSPGSKIDALFDAATGRPESAAMDHPGLDSA